MPHQIAPQIRCRRGIELAGLSALVTSATSAKMAPADHALMVGANGSLKKKFAAPYKLGGVRRCSRRVESIAAAQALREQHAIPMGTSSSNGESRPIQSIATWRRAFLRSASIDRKTAIAEKTATIGMVVALTAMVQAR